MDEFSDAVTADFCFDLAVENGLFSVVLLITVDLVEEFLGLVIFNVMNYGF